MDLNNIYRIALQKNVRHTSIWEKVTSNHTYKIGKWLIDLSNRKSKQKSSEGPEENIAWLVGKNKII